jgi:hypothetical protein
LPTLAGTRPEVLLQKSEKKKERERDFELFQKEQANLKVSREIKNEEINQIETKGKRKKAKSCLFEKIIKIDKSIPM